MLERIAAAALAGAVLLSPRAVSAYDAFNGSSAGLHTATSIGPRAAYYRPIGSDFGEWSPGVQLRLHVTQAYAMEGSADFTHNSFGGTRVNVIPVQVSLLGFLYPETTLSPYLLFGGGWYKTQVQGPSARSQERFGPHIGVGLQMLLNENWSIDGSYRFLWTETLHLQDLSHPVGQNFSSKGYLITAALNYRL